MAWLKRAWSFVRDYASLFFAAAVGLFFMLWRSASRARDAAKREATDANLRADNARASAERERFAAEVARKTAERVRERELERIKRAEADEAAAAAEVAHVRKEAEAKKSLADEVNKRIKEGRL